jgi:hypothetical protein
VTPETAPQGASAGRVVRPLPARADDAGAADDAPAEPGRADNVTRDDGARDGAESARAAGAPESQGRRRRRADSGRSEDGPEGLLPARAAEDTGRAWGDWRDDGDTNDERLLRDRPPHWG